MRQADEPEINVGPSKPARANHEKNDHCEKRGVCCTLFSQWSIRVSQQLGIFNFMATDHRENGSGFFHNGPAGWLLVRTVRISGAPLTPLREKSGTPVALTTQAISESRVNVMDPCATFFGDLA